MISRFSFCSKALAFSLLLLLTGLSTAQAYDWLHARGPQQNGTSEERDLPDEIELDGKNHLWSYSLSSGAVPAIHGDRVYTIGYEGEGQDLQEVLVALEADTGKKIWERRYSDFLSDIIYNRYAIGSPAVDPDTGNIYLHTSPGLLIAFDRDGNKLWEHSMMEEFARLTFPNGRTGGAYVDGDLVILHAITANWGGDGPARDRFYAFDKRSGDLVWYSTPAIQPVDSSYAELTFDDVDGRRVFYSGTGCGNVVCVDARTGEPLWRFKMSNGGVNSGVVLPEKGKLVAIHGKENLDTSDHGRMVMLNIPTEFPADGDYPMVLGSDSEVWRADLEAFTSTPVYHAGKVYQTVKTGELVAVDARTGQTIWSLKLGPDQLHAGPVYADGKLYVPMFDGKFFIVSTDGQILDEVDLEGACIAPPAVANGRVYVHTKEKLYCFGQLDQWSKRVEKQWRKPGEPVSLQIVPAEFSLMPGGKVDFKVYAIDAHGLRVKQVEDVQWEKFIPPTARVKSTVDAAFEGNTLVAGEDAEPSAGAFKATAGGLTGTARGRLVTDIPYRQDFEDFELTESDPDGYKFSYPPLEWLGARMRWQVQLEGDNKILGNTLDRVLFQRSMNFFGDPSMKNYTLQADVKTDGNRRVMSNVGVINQRYIIQLVGNWQAIEVISNHERIKKRVPFSWQANKWYTLKTRVDVSEDGSGGYVRAKAWPKGEPEPEGWNVEVFHKDVHKHGAPGIWGFSPQSRKKVFIDNIVLTPNEG